MDTADSTRTSLIRDLPTTRQSVNPYEFYETPRTFVRYLFSEVRIFGRVCEPCVGSGAIPAAATEDGFAHKRSWVTNDLDPRWPADTHHDATTQACWDAIGTVAWTVSNPAFTPAIAITDRALRQSTVGVAMYLRGSIHEVLKTGARRWWMRTHPPTGILWLPRFGYQRNSKGKWSSDSMTACWVIWLKDPDAPQFIRYAPEWVVADSLAETPGYRARMDALMARLAGDVPPTTLE